MELNLTPNPLHRQVQTLRIDKVATLIGENGSGKSSILQSVFIILPRNWTKKSW